MKINKWFLLGGAIGIIGMAALFTALFIKMNYPAQAKIDLASSKTSPAKIKITVISDKDCSDCFEIKNLVDQIKQQNIKLTSEKNLEKSDKEAKKLIKKFDIKKLPTLVISGDLEKNDALKNFFSQAGDITKKTFVFRKVNPPYILVDTGEIKGRVNFTILTDDSCKTCHNPSQHIQILSGFGINSAPNMVDVNSDNGKQLVEKYKIKSVPTFILSGDLSEYEQLKSVWDQVGDVAEDGSLIFTKGVTLMGVYKDLDSGKIIEPETKK